MSLDGLRAWIGEVERKLGMRTRVFLALAVIAIGGAGAAIYLAVDARESSVSESDVQALQERLEARIDEVATSTSATPPAEPAEPVEPGAETESGESEKDGATDGTGTGGASAEGSGAVGGASNSKLKELVEQAAEQNAEAEGENAAGK
jgi:hypothetical protein